MRIDELKGINQVSVFKAREKIGILTRTDRGSIYEYQSEYLQKYALEPEAHMALCFRMPCTQKTYLTRGENLAPFFAGLLPEGLRLKALIRTAKTSADDLFTLLIASGNDLIGDISVAATGEQFQEQPKLKAQKLKQVNFWSLFHESIESNRMEQRLIDPSMPGAHAKLSAAMISFPVGVSNRNKRYLLKLAPKEYPRLVENEHFFMQMAASCGLPVAKTTVVQDSAKSSGLLVERFDRYYNRTTKQIVAIHQEDACQFLGRYPQDKYRLDFRTIAKGMQEFCTAPIVEIYSLLRLVAFSYIIANGDLHAKNISIQVNPADGRVSLAPAYDILSTLPYGDSQMALSFEGKTENLRAEMFLRFARAFDIKEGVVKSMLSTLVKDVAPWSKRLSEIGLSSKQTKHLERTMTERLTHLG